MQPFRLLPLSQLMMNLCISRRAAIDSKPAYIALIGGLEVTMSDALTKLHRELGLEEQSLIDEVTRIVRPALAIAHDNRV